MKEQNNAVIHGDDYKVKELKKMLEHETSSSEDHYGAHLSHWFGDTKTLTIDAGGIAALIEYYSTHVTDLDKIPDCQEAEKSETEDKHIITPLDTAKKLIDEYCKSEYGLDEGADYSNLSEVNIAYTTIDDDQHEVQSTVNLVDFRIETLVDGKVVRSEQYDSLEDMIECSLSSLDFDELVYLPYHVLEQINNESGAGAHNEESLESDDKTAFKIDIDLENGYKLVAQRNTDPLYDREIFVGVVDNNGVWDQDLAIVRNSYTIEDGKPIWKEKQFDVIVYGDKNSEDFTDDYSIGLHE